MNKKQNSQKQSIKPSIWGHAVGNLALCFLGYPIIQVKKIKRTIKIFMLLTYLALCEKCSKLFT